MKHSRKQLYLIYIPGLGDTKVTWQRRAVATWKWWGVESELFQMNWADKEPWEPKFERLLERIDQVVADGYQVGLVAASAGASAAMNAFAARKDVVVGLVLIAGKVNRPDAINHGLRRENPAFHTSALTSKQAKLTLGKADRKRILSRFSLLDSWVPFHDSIVRGANNRISPTIGHAGTIGAQITLGAPSFIFFLNRRKR